MKNYFVKFYKSGHSLALLQWAYGTVAIISLLISGILALMNQPLGLSILIVPAVAGGAFALNLLVWAIIKLAFDSVVANEEIKKK